MIYLTVDVRISVLPFSVRLYNGLKHAGMRADQRA